MKLLLATALIALGVTFAFIAKAQRVTREMRLYRSTRAAMTSFAVARAAKWAAMVCVGVGVLLLH